MHKEIHSKRNVDLFVPEERKQKKQAQDEKVRSDKPNTILPQVLEFVNTLPEFF